MMGLRLFPLVLDPATARFNDELVREFLADQGVESVSDHFFVKDGTPYRVLVARYRQPALPPPSSAPEGTGKGGRQRDESWRDTLAPDLWPLFNTLRDWRGERARCEGIPSYVICNQYPLFFDSP